MPSCRAVRHAGFEGAPSTRRLSNEDGNAGGAPRVHRRRGSPGWPYPDWSQSDAPPAPRCPSPRASCADCTMPPAGFDPQGYGPGDDRLGRPSRGGMLVLPQRTWKPSNVAFRHPPRPSPFAAARLRVRRAPGPPRLRTLRSGWPGSARTGSNVTRLRPGAPARLANPPTRPAPATPSSPMAYGLDPNGRGGGCSRPWTTRHRLRIEAAVRPQCRTRG